MSLDNHDLTTDFIDTTQDDVQQRYVELVVKQRERKTQHEFAITKVGPYATDSFSFFPGGRVCILASQDVGRNTTRESEESN